MRATNGPLRISITFVHDPKSFAPKTKMVFSGVKRDQQRADVLAYLRSLSDSPKPLPAP